MRFQIEHGGQVVSATTGVPEKLDELLDQVMDVLMDTPEAIDADMSATLSDGKVQIRFEIEATSPSEAIGKADPIIRAAIHGAGIATPEWKGAKRSLSFQDGAWHVTPSSVVEALVEAG